jgi:hypothetical protein
VRTGERAQHHRRRRRGFRRVHMGPGAIEKIDRGGRELTANAEGEGRGTFSGRYLATLATERDWSRSTWGCRDRAIYDVENDDELEPAN